MIGPYLGDKKRHLEEVVRPLQERAEPVYVVPGSDAEAVARHKFKNKTVKPVGSGLRPRTISSLLYFMPFVFQPNQSRGLDATFHFSFTGAERKDTTITIKNRTLDIQNGLVGTPDIHVTADSQTWLGFLAKEKNLVLALLSRKVRLKGNPRLLLAFGKCFPSPDVRHPQVQILPQASKLTPEPARYRKNDPATGKIRWRGRLALAGVEAVTHNVKTFQFNAVDGERVPFEYLAGQFLTAAHRAARCTDQPVLHHRLDTYLARSDRNHGQARGPWPGVAVAARRSKTWGRGRCRSAERHLRFHRQRGG